MKENPNNIQNGMKLPTNMLIPIPMMERAKINSKAISQFWILKLAVFLMLLLLAFFSSGLPLLSAVLVEGMEGLVSAESMELLGSMAVGSTLVGVIVGGTSFGLMSFIRFSHSSGVIFDFGDGIQRIGSPLEVSLQCPLCSLAASILEKCLPHLPHIISIR